MNPSDVVALLPSVAAATREAGLLALGWFRRDAKTAARVWWKDGDSPVTEADVAVDALLRERLEALDPAIGWLSEEAERHPQGASEAPAWIVDPIDGTRGYMAGNETWAVSVALAQGGRPQIACLFLPAVGKLFTAAAGDGVALNGAPLSDAAPAPRLAAGPRPTLDRLLAQAPGLAAHPKIPSLAARIAAVAERRIALAIATEGAREWDIAAADLILSESGGRLTDLHGKPVRYEASPRRQGALLASCEANHDAFAASLGAALANHSRS